MSEHIAELSWKRDSETFGYKDYSRNHSWRFDAGVEIKGSAAQAYLGDPSGVDPEEAFTASLSSCHLLTFLAIASRMKLTLDAYEDRAVGHMEKNEQGKMAITRVDLHPRVTFAPGVEVDKETLDRMHHEAHEHCFIANSVKTEIVVHSEE